MIPVGLRGPPQLGPGLTVARRATKAELGEIFWEVEPYSYAMNRFPSRSGWIDANQSSVVPLKVRYSSSTVLDFDVIFEQRLQPLTAVWSVTGWRIIQWTFAFVAVPLFTAVSCVA